MSAPPIRDPGEFLAVLPYHLGFHPTASLVLASLDGRRLGLVQRLDVPPDGPPPTAALDRVADVLAGQDAAGVLVVLVLPPGPLADAVALAALREGIPAGVDVQAVLVVDAGRWWSWGCAAPACCPAEGHPVPAPEDVPAIAEYVARGIAPLPSREELVALLHAPDPAAAAPPWRGPPGPPPTWRRALGAWGRLLAAPSTPSPAAAAPTADADVTLALRGLRDVTLRDALLHWFAPALVPRSAVDATLARRVEHALGPPAGPAAGMPIVTAGERALLFALARAAPPGDRAPILTLLAAWAWARGEGAVAAVALDEARADDPGYALAGLLTGLVANGIRIVCA